MANGSGIPYLLLDVVEGIGRVDRKADQDDVGVRVGEGTETVIVFLASSIPQGEFNVLVVNLDIGDVVLEDGGDVDLKDDYQSDRGIHFHDRWIRGTMMGGMRGKEARNSVRRERDDGGS